MNQITPLIRTFSRAIVRVATNHFLSQQSANARF